LLQRDVEAQRLGQESLPKIETVGEIIIESGIEHELAAAERAAFGLEPVPQLRAAAATTLRFLGNKIVHLEETAVDQIFGDPVSGQRIWSLIGAGIPPQREDAIALGRLPAPALNELIR
jgi:hypothetical protein